MEPTDVIGRSSADNDFHCLVFLHIPKAAGKTLGTVLRRNFPVDQRHVRLNILDRPLQEELGSIPFEKRSRLRLLAGHLPYGVHEYIPRSCDYITILREPVDRVISVYNHILMRPAHVLHKQVVESGMSLEQYVESGIDEGQTENSQTRQISGRQFGVVDNTTLQRAKENLMTFRLIGLRERFEETIALVRRNLRLHTSLYLTKNVSPPLQVSTRARELVRDRNELDLELYELARALFLEQIDQQGKSFAFEVSALRQWKPVSRAFGAFSDKAVERLRSDPIAKRVALATRKLIP